MQKMTEAAFEVKEVESRLPSLVDSCACMEGKLRIQVIDRGNYTCDFWMPDGPERLGRASFPTFEELARISDVFAQTGCRKDKVERGVRPHWADVHDQ
jgi:hypothetical protein